MRGETLDMRRETKNSKLKVQWSVDCGPLTNLK
jgi:hypothetical protein